jgi:diguanylate cyclase (GGDEF)-like protein
MPELTRSEAQALARYVARFIEAFRRDVVLPLAAQLRNCQPAEVGEVLAQLSLLERALEIRSKRVAVHDAHRPLLKRVLIDQRREVAREIDVPLQKAVDGQVIKMLRRELHLLEHFMQGDWFAETSALRVPALTDYLSIRHAEAALPDPLEPRPREYDEKFHILEAPSLFLPDLAYYRRRCRFRDAPIAVAYLDIDDFKDFNTRHTETKVDLTLLAPFMEILEAHTFAHGHAYRFGGDEYVLLLPNATSDWAVAFVRALQQRIRDASFVGIDRAPTVSAGLVVVDVDCWLIDREVLGLANEAKNYAKAHAKGSVAGCVAASGQVGDITPL